VCVCPNLTKLSVHFASYDVARSSSGGVGIRSVLPVFMDGVIFGHIGPHEAASEVIASSCAGCGAAAASYWLRRVLHDGGD